MKTPPLRPLAPLCHGIFLLVALVSCGGSVVSAAIGLVEGDRLLFTSPEEGDWALLATAKD